MAFGNCLLDDQLFTRALHGVDEFRLQLVRRGQPITPEQA